MDANMRMYNQEVVREGLRRRAEARKEAIRKQEEAHERFEKAMLKAVNQHAADAKKREEQAAAPLRVVAAAKVKKHKRPSPLARMIAEGDDCMLHIYVCSGAFVVCGLLRCFLGLPAHTGIALCVFLAAWFSFNVYKLYQISGGIAELSEGD